MQHVSTKIPEFDSIRPTTDAKSSGLLKLFRDIHFRYECCMDTLTGLPITDSRILIEDDYVDINTVYYDHLSRKDSSLIYSK
jgi:hypothetical protein